QAVDICKSINKIDLILMDIKMPLLNGYDATKQIKEINPNIPIIAQTAFSMKNDRIKCIQAGCDDYISKPIDIERLFNKMKSLLTETH
ncbi:MAG: response regulator, partial [Bacteroidales bacterium]|nr:response regulator [Bacteroidales bacterium]